MDCEVKVIKQFVKYLIFTFQNIYMFIKTWAGMSIDQQWLTMGRRITDYFNFNFISAGLLLSKKIFFFTYCYVYYFKRKKTKQKAKKLPKENSGKLK